MADDPALPLNPKDTTNFLLGGMQKQLEAISLEQAHARDTGEQFRNEIRTSVSELTVRVAGVERAQTPKTPWYSVVTGMSGIAAIVIAVIALLNVVNP